MKGKLVNLRRRSLDGKLVSDACEARDGASKGLQGVPADTKFHPSLSHTLSPSLSLSQTKSVAGTLTWHWREYEHSLEKISEAFFVGPVYLDMKL